MDNIITALDHARQLANIASDWNLDEVEKAKLLPYYHPYLVSLRRLLDQLEAKRE